MSILNIFAKAKTTVLTQTKIEEPAPIWSNKITPGEISMAMMQANGGNLQAINTLFQKLYRYDDNLSGDTDVRVEALKSASFILPEGLTKQQEEFFTSFLNKFFATLIDHALALKLRGNLFKQIAFKLEDNLYTIDKFIAYKGIDLRIVDSELALYADGETVTLPDDKFVRIYKDTCVYESIIKYYAFFSFALNNWASFMETYGKPIRIGKYKAGTDKKEKETLRKMVKNLGSDLGAVISDNTLIEFADFKNASANAGLYSIMLDFCKKSISKRILGQTLTTNSEKSGSYAQAKVHDMVRQDILQADIRDCSHYISEICSRLNRLNFTEHDINIKLSLPEKIDLSTKIAIDTKLNEIIEIEPEYWYTTYNIPIPKAGAKVKEVTGITSIPAGRSSSASAKEVTSKDVPFLPSGLAISSLGPLGIPAGISSSGNTSLSAGRCISSAYFNKTNKKVAKINEKYLSKLDTFEKAKNAPFPGELYYYYGSELSKLLLASYTKQKRDTASAVMERGLSSSGLSSSSSSPGTSALADASSSSFEIDWNMEDLAALHAFRQQAFEVAGVNCDELNSMIKSEAEKAFKEGLEFNEFRDNLKLKGFEADNPYHIKTNFETAVNGAKSAAKWLDIEDLKDIYPFLKYLTMGDDKVRDEHKAWHGLILSVDDIFWDENYAPNGYGCRCDVEQLTEDEAKQEKRYGDKPDPYTKTDSHFKGNAGKDKSIWGNWLKEQNAKSTDYKELNIQDWSKVKGAVKQPQKLEFANNEEAKTYFNDNIAGMNKDIAKYPTNIPGSLFNDISKINQDNMNFIKPTLESPNEVWTDTNKNTNYLKKFKTGTSKIVVNIAGEVIEFDLPGESKITSLRKGNCLKK